jgi:hypothetical protein
MKVARKRTMGKRKVKKLEKAGRSIDGNAKANPLDYPKPFGQLPNCIASSFSRFMARDAISRLSRDVVLLKLIIDILLLVDILSSFGLAWICFPHISLSCV